MPQYQWGTRQPVVCFCFCLTITFAGVDAAFAELSYHLYKNPINSPEGLFCASPVPAEVWGEEQSSVCNSTWWVGKAPGLLLLCCLCFSAALSALLNSLESVCLFSFVWCFIFKANTAGWEATLNRTAVCWCCKWSLCSSFQKTKIFLFLFAQQSGLAEVLGSWCWFCGSYSSFVCCFIDLSRAKGTRKKAPQTVKQISAPASQ